MAGIELTWAGGEHNFSLPIEQLRALQQKCDAGPEWILMRLSNRQWLVDDVTETIRLGLEGGGLSKPDARKLVQNFVEDRPLTESLKTAQLVLMTALYSADLDDVPGELKAAAE
jgi:Phage tail tube protein, GTA-gp10